MHQTTPHSRTASQELLSPAAALRPGNRPGVDSASNDPRSASKDEFHMLWPFRRNRNVGTRAVVATDLLVEEEKGRKERRLEPGEYHIFEFPLLDPKDLLARRPTSFYAVDSLGVGYRPTRRQFKAAMAWLQKAR